MESSNDSRAISKEHRRVTVMRACTDLKLAGQPVTNRTVREVVGGSPNDLAPIIKEFKVLESQRAVAAMLTIPADIKEQSDALVAGMWQSATHLASKELAILHDRIEALEHDAQKEEQQHYEETAKLSVQIERQQLEIDQAAQTIVMLKEQLRTEQDARQKLDATTQVEIAKLNAELSAASIREQDASRGKVQFESEATKLRGELTASEKKTAKLEGMLEIMQEDLIKAKKEADDIGADRAKLLSTNALLQQKVSDLTLQSKLVDQLELIRQDLHLKDRKKPDKLRPSSEETHS